jgi:cellulose biosynthesis protein BcsN
MHSSERPDRPRQERGQRTIAARVLAGALCAFAGLSLAGCIALDASNPRVLSQRTAAGPEDSFVAMPAGGPAIVGVIERRYGNAVVRKTVLATNARGSGENMMTVSLYGPIADATGEDNLATEDSIDPDQIAIELRRYLPGVPMQPSTLFVQNKYGPFGFATGTAASGDRCLYAWQRIHRGRSPFVGEGTIAVRLRLCDAYAGYEQLLSVMYGYTITGYLPNTFWNPYGKAPPVAADLGGLSAEKFPLGAQALAEPAPSAAPRRRVRAHAAAIPAEKAPAPQILVPEPPAAIPAPPAAKSYPIVPGPTP